jgi:hypothetical protein
MKCNAAEDTQLCNLKECPEDCIQNEWGKWSQCSNDDHCTGGKKERRRTIFRSPKVGGVACGPSQQFEECDSAKCIEHCKMSAWAPWSACSTNCGTMGTKHRTRTVVKEAGIGGNRCPPSQETHLCKEKCEVIEGSDKCGQQTYDLEDEGEPATGHTWKVNAICTYGQYRLTFAHEDNHGEHRDDVPAHVTVDGRSVPMVFEGTISTALVNLQVGQNEILVSAGENMLPTIKSLTVNEVSAGASDSQASDYEATR